MTKFKLRGAKNALWALKVKKLFDTPEGMKERIEKIHLKGNEEYDSEALTQSFNCQPISWEEIKTQLGDNIIWTDEKEVKPMSNDNDKPTEEKKKDDEEDD